MIKCYGCGKGFAAADVMVEWSLVRALLGEKSGVLGVYPHQHNPDNEKDYIHTDPSCLEASFSPMVETSFMWDIVADQARQIIIEEERATDPDDYPELSVEALLEDPPYCLWCKRKDSVWMHFSLAYPVSYCFGCMRFWDHDEDELERDPATGEFYVIQY